MPRHFIIVDVFTDRAFGGNQLAVFPDAAGIGDGEMQAFARELNFSESTFVLPPRKPGHTHRVRIFNPAAEMPFAGHPNVGTAMVLAALSGKDGVTRFVFDEDVGTVKVDATIAPGRGFAELALERAAEIRPLGVARDRLAAMLSLPEDAVAPGAPWIASAGIPFCCIRLADRDWVARARLDLGVWERTLEPHLWSRDVYVFAGDTQPGGTLKVRMWGPAVGVPEDPATGSAAAALAGSLAAALPDAEGIFGWTIEQGAEIGRPSLIQATAEKRAGSVVRLRVGGDAVIVGEGRFH